MYLLGVILFLVIAVHCFAQVQELQCKPKAGCHITRCDPLPITGERLENLLQNNEFPITCSLPSGQTNDTSVQELRKEMQSFQNDVVAELQRIKRDQESVLNAMQAKLDKAERAVARLVQARYAGVGVTCTAPPKIVGGKVSCTGKNFESESTCKVTCGKGREMKGSNNVVCGKDGKWSTPFPTCECAKCRSGDNCEISNSWADARATMGSAGGKSSIRYAGNSVTCISATHVHDWTFKWRCTCTDDVTNDKVVCSQWSSAEKACRVSGSELIRRQVKSKVYPKPCDENLLDTGTC